MSRLLKFQSLVVLICVASILSFGCQSVVSNPPAGCENSKIYANKATIDLVLSVVVAGACALANTNPAYYRMAHESAQAAASLLRQQPISLSGLTDNLLINILSPLLGLIPVDQILSQCDRNYLADYLEMI